MKLFALALIATAILTSVALAGSSTTAVSQSELRAEPKITELVARKIALCQTPEGTVKSIELEREKGLLIWSVDLAVRDTKNITEVGIDATTGAVVTVDTETPRKQEIEKDEPTTKTNRRLGRRPTELNASVWDWPLHSRP